MAWGIVLISAFVIWTALIQLIDVKPAGQNGTNIGFAAINTRFFALTGVHMTIYTLTDWLGLVSSACVHGIWNNGIYSNDKEKKSVESGL